MAAFKHSLKKLSLYVSASVTNEKIIVNNPKKTLLPLWASPVVIHHETLSIWKHQVATPLHPKLKLCA